MSDVFVVPAWVAEHIKSHNGGWFYPIRVDAQHPVVIEKWPCLYCECLFYENDWLLVMPFHGEFDSEWVAAHRMCIMQSFGFIPKGINREEHD